MKKSTLPLIVLLLVTSLAFQPKPSTKLPELNLRNLEGQTINIADYGKNNKVTIISFWATWCKPCVKELRAIYENYEDWQDVVPFEVVAVSIDDSRSVATVPAFVNSEGWDFDILLDEAGQSKLKFNYTNPPYTVLVNAEGDIVYRHTAYKAGDEEELLEHLEELAAE